jgi:predicted  nucleic acid-binding Zn-ribbon protein
MKNTAITLALSTIITGALLTGCSSPEEKVKDAQDNVTTANNKLDSANQEYLADIESYKKQTADSIAANQQSIQSFNERIAKAKLEDREEYQAKINDLNNRDSDMKKKMDDYKAEGKEKWEAFKAGFSHDMDELGKSIRDLKNKITS